MTEDDSIFFTTLNCDNDKFLMNQVNLHHLAPVDILLWDVLTCHKMQAHKILWA